jgi:hypothetical protein
MLKFFLVAAATDGAAWIYDPKVGGVLLFALLIANFILALSHSTS